MAACEDDNMARYRAWGRGNKFGQASAVRVSMTNHPLKDGIYAADFAGSPEKLPRPRFRTDVPRRHPGIRGFIEGGFGKANADGLNAA